MLACLRVLYQNGSLNYGVVGFILVGVFFFFFGGGGGGGEGGGCPMLCMAGSMGPG